MTVTYTAEVSNCRGLGCFWKLLFRWKGSIYKLLWPNLLVYMLFYYIIFIVYRFVLDDLQKKKFEIIAKYCNDYSDLIPLSFVLGFYVNLVMQRWWNMYCNIPSTDTLSIFVSNSIHGQDERCRLMRRTIMRYVNLSYVLILSMISTRVKKRFPTLEHMVDAGVMLPGEKKIFDDLNSRSSHHKYWMPLVWAGSVIARARKEGRIRDDFAVKTLLDELCNFRSKCGALNAYDWVNIPLVYTQVVTLAVYSFFVATLMGRQLIGAQTELYFPVFAFLQFFFYMGWLKVAESMVNPFGEDDDDFETNFLIDRNLQVSYLIVDEMHAEHPELIRDQYWDDVLPDELPHTVASQPLGHHSPYMGSTAHIAIPAQQTEIFNGSATPQLHKLDEVSEASTSLDDDDIPSDGGESGITIKQKAPKRRLKRQTSVQSEATNSYRVSRKPSIISVIQRVFNKEGPNGMGSNLSIASSRRPTYGRSNSRYSRPQSPTSTQNQEEIFKMSDLSLNISASNLQATVSKGIDNPDETRRPPRAPPSLLKKIEKIGRKGLGVESQVHPVPVLINNTEDQEPLILDTSAIELSNSPLSVPKKHTLQRPISPCAFSFPTAVESSQTDLTAAPKFSLVDETRTIGNKEESVTSIPPSSPPPLIHLDSITGEEGLEVINEHSESSCTPVEKVLE